MSEEIKHPTTQGAVTAEDKGRCAPAFCSATVKLQYTVDADTIKDPHGNVMQGTDEFVQEMQGLMDALHDLFKSNAMLRVSIIGMSPKLQALHAWEWNTESMKKAEAWIRHEAKSPNDTLCRPAGDAGGAQKKLSK